MRGTGRISVGPEDVDLDILNNVPGYFIRGLSIAVGRDWESRLIGLEGVRGADRVTALFLMDRHPGIRPSMIARITLKDRSETARMLDRLEASGLIERRHASPDIRVRGLFLTRHGSQVVTELRQRLGNTGDYLSDFSDAEQTQFLTMLRHLYWRAVQNKPPRQSPPEAC